MGGSASNIVNPIVKAVTAPITGGLSLIHSKYNPLDKSFDPLGSRAAKREARTAADQQRDAMVAQEGEAKEQKKQAKQTANNSAIRARLLARRGYMAASTRGGTLLTGPSGLPSDTGGGQKTLLGT